MAYTTRLGFCCFKNTSVRDFPGDPEGKPCTPNVGCLGSIAGQGPDPTCHNSRVRMLQLRPGAVERKHSRGEVGSGEGTDKPTLKTLIPLKIEMGRMGITVHV